MTRLFVLDAMGLVYRAHYAFIRRPLINSRGEHTSALYGFANSVLKIRREERPDYWALAWDGPGPTERHQRYPEYKAFRKPIPSELLAQIPAIEEMAEALGLPVLEVPGMEADDVMATLARCAEQEGHEVVLVTSDKDMLQLVNDRVRLLSPVGRGEDYVWVDRDTINAKWGVAPEQIRDVLALMGDTSDNIPGVPGIGQKTASELIARFGSVDALYQGLDQLPRQSLREKLETHRDAALLSRELVTVKADCDLPHRWDELRCGPIRRDLLRTLAERYELVRLVRIADEDGVPDAELGKRPRARGIERHASGAETEGPGVELAGGGSEGSLPETGESSVKTLETESPPFSSPPTAAQGRLELWPSQAEQFSGDPLTCAARVEAIRVRAVHGVALLPVQVPGDPRTAPLIGLALAARDGTTCYVPIGHGAGLNIPKEQVREWLAPILTDPSVPKVGEDLKRDAHALATLGLGLEGMGFDIHLGSFLCDPERDHSLTALTKDVLGLELMPAESLVGRSRSGAAAAGVRSPHNGGRTGRATLDSVEAGTLAPWAEQAVTTLFPIADALRMQLEAREQWTLYETLEHPLIPVLLDMERVGVQLDAAVLAEMSKTNAEEVGRLEEELYALAGERFNLNSGPQLSRILFDKLGLKSGRRTKTGFSTDQAVLEELALSHAFPARLLEYRALSKLRSTYLEALPQVVDPRDGRVHTTYHQAGAATGRLSSSNPNLQNIPMRTSQGRAIRRAFVAPAGRTLVGADHSQIELRIMAHLSGDPNLIEAFRAGEDIHASTARKVFRIPEGPLDPGLRSRAKVVNFGIMYGMGARSLSQQMGISLSEAQEFIRNYFDVYARVREFLTATVEESRRRGYAQTLFSRRRYLPGLESSNGAVRSFAERVAINMPIQGSAADLMKLAMVNVHAALKRSFPSAKLLLQVHDELVIECSIGEAEAVSECVRLEMERCFALRVPLEVSVGHGPSWFDVH